MCFCRLRVRRPKVLMSLAPSRHRAPGSIHYFWYLALLRIGLKFLKFVAVWLLFERYIQKISSLLFQLFGLLLRQWCSILYRNYIVPAIWQIVRRSFDRKKWF